MCIEHIRATLAAQDGDLAERVQILVRRQREGRQCGRSVRQAGHRRWPDRRRVAESGRIFSRSQKPRHTDLRFQWIQFRKWCWIGHTLIALLIIVLVLLQRGKGCRRRCGIRCRRVRHRVRCARLVEFLLAGDRGLATVFFASSLTLAYLSSQRTTAPTSMLEDARRRSRRPRKRPIRRMPPLPDVSRHRLSESYRQRRRRHAGARSASDDAAESEGQMPSAERVK